MKLKNTKYTYPFGVGWVILSVLLVAMAVLIPIYVCKSIYEVVFYLAFTSSLTVFMLLLKFYLFFIKGLGQREYTVEMQREENLLHEKPKLRRIKWSMILVMILTLLSLLLPITIIQLAGPSLGLMLISGFIIAINLPEVILYIYANYFKKKK